MHKRRKIAHATYPADGSELVVKYNKKFYKVNSEEFEGDVEGMWLEAEKWAKRQGATHLKDDVGESKPSIWKITLKRWK